MKVYRSLQEYEQGTNTVATIGTFDGVHNGHKKILQRVIDAARAINGESLMISLHPHPRLVLFPEDNPLRLLQSIEEKIDMLDSLGIDKLLLIPFTREFSRTSSESFIKDILVDCVGIKRIVIGYDHHFGKNRTGGLKDLMRGGAVHGFAVEEIPAEQIDNASISSTKIRNALNAGDLVTANKFLGYEYVLRGTVVKGKQLGRTLGYPTANIEPEDKWKLIPANGIYLVRVELEEGRSSSSSTSGSASLSGTGRGVRNHWGLMSIGVRPTVGKDLKRVAEVNILDFDGDLYGQVITTRFLRRIRNEEKFESLDELVEWMKKDEAIGRKWIEELENHDRI